MANHQHWTRYSREFASPCLWNQRTSDDSTTSDVLVVDYNYYEKRCRAYVNDTPLGHQQFPRLIRNGKESSEADEIELRSRFICPE